MAKSTIGAHEGQGGKNAAGPSSGAPLKKASAVSSFALGSADNAKKGPPAGTGSVAGFPRD